MRAAQRHSVPRPSLSGIPLGLLVCALTTACSAPATLPEEFIATARRTAPNATVRLTIAGDDVRAVAVPVGAEDLPLAVTRAVASIQPGGELTAEREWSAAGESFRIVTAYGPEDERSVRLAVDGTMHERSHTLALDAVAKDARTAVAARNLGSIERVEVVQGVPTREWYRFWTRHEDGTRHIVECTLEGDAVRIERVVRAELALR